MDGKCEGIKVKGAGGWWWWDDFDGEITIVIRKYTI